jgi:hypothetical protein
VIVMTSTLAGRGHEQAGHERAVVVDHRDGDPEVAERHRVAGAKSQIDHRQVDNRHT